MRIYYHLEDFPRNFSKPVATIGNFDGIHLGHRALMQCLVERARKIGGTSTIVTFHPHPLAVLAPNNAPRMIQTLDQKLSCMQDLGIDLVVVIPFTLQLAQTRAREFATEILWKSLGLHEIYVGPTFAFGHRREGSFNLLKEIGEEKGFLVGKIHQIQFRGARVSSTAIRQSLISGQVALARRLLGRPFALEGEIVHGTATGSHIRVPTANLKPDNELIPRSGVYVSILIADGKRHKSVTNIGVRPTMTGGADAPLTIETHVLEFSGSLYEKKVSLELLLRLREERRFPDAAALVGQIRKDVARAVRYFEWLGRHAPSYLN